MSSKMSECSWTRNRAWRF